ncbi:MAG: DUF2156 domain-containing protein [Paludibacteraceae bacterium]
MLTFKKIELNDKSILNSFLFDEKTNLFTYRFEVLWLWRNVFDFQYAVCEQNNVLFIKTFTKGVHYFLFPVGSKNLQACTELILNSAKQIGCEPIIGQITPENKSLLEQTFPNQFRFESNRDEFEYLYLTEKLCSLSGKKLQPKRNNINFLTKNYACSTEPVSANNMEECFAFSHHWDTVLHSDFSENIAFYEALSAYKTLALDTLVLRLNGCIEGISIGCPLNNDVYLILFEKANPQIRGAYSLINRDFCRTYCTNYRFVNRAEDAGIEGLRKAKLSYYPDLLQEVFLAQKV